jgi:hypothetical protein
VVTALSRSEDALRFVHDAFLTKER